MTDNAFDPARAAAGEPVQFCLTDGKWVDVHYVGPDRVRGGHFVQFPDGGTVSTGALRMKPPAQWALVFDSEAAARAAARVLVGPGLTSGWRLIEWPGDAL
jgi:hypothetical protein